MLRKAVSANNVPLLSKILSNLHSSSPKSINDIDNSGRSALMIASERGYTECVKLLLAYGADTTIRTIRGMTALIWASNRGHFQCVKLLLDFNVNMNIKDLHGGTALIYACKYGNFECVDLLVEARLTDVANRCEVNIRDKWGMTALMYASREGFLECCLKLLEFGADYRLTDKQGKCALDYAKTEDIAELIECCMMTTYLFR